MDYIAHYESPLGQMTLASDGMSLTGLWFDGQKNFGASLAQQHEERALPVFSEAKNWLDIYFSGKEPGFIPRLLLRGTLFQREVWKLLLAVPYGHTTTYGALADILAAQRHILKMSARAVGTAVGHNPVSLIVPCHRIIGASGALTGYAGGTDRKAKLLMLEGNTISGRSVML